MAINQRPVDNLNPSVQLTLVDDHATGFATFQSHNQKVVSNRRGIFLTYIRSRNEPYTAQRWRLCWSTDGGDTFKVLHEDENATNPPVLETDARDNIYLVRVDFQNGDAYLYRFLAVNKYAGPRVSTIPGGGTGKYTMLIDRPRRQLYYLANNNSFYVVGFDGTVKTHTTLLTSGTSAHMEYPLLALDEQGTLHAAWTTQKHGVYLYWDIHYMRSPDAGQTWETMKGEPLSPPIVADETGPTDRITRDDEFGVHTWLSSFLVRNRKAHFVYLAQATPLRQHYLRYDLKTAQRDVDIWPEFTGQAIALRGLDGFLTSASLVRGRPIYCVMPEGDRLASLVSYDRGRTWRDHAISQETFNLYSIGGSRVLTADGYIIGSFTDYHPDPDYPRVYFFKIKGAPRVGVPKFP